MQSVYLTAAFAVLVLFATISRGSAQVRCFTSEVNCQTATDPDLDPASIQECCLSPNGMFFEDAGNCIACIVFGWFDGTNITLDEQVGNHELQAGFIKGGAVQTFIGAQSLASFLIAFEERGAVEGVNADFSIPTPMRSLFGQDPPPFSVSVTVRSDGVALEPAEGFVLRLAPINMIAMNILAEGMPGVIARPEISVIIRDLDTVSIQFTEVDYSRTEDLGFIRPQLQLSTPIATDLIVEVVPLNLTYARDNELLTGPFDPALDPGFDNNTQIATSGDDFSIMPVRVTFDSERSGEDITLELNKRITNDTIHEADQVFVLRLEAISNVVLEMTSGLTSLARIIDDDNIFIGFQQERYTVFEADAMGNETQILVFKANGQESELQITVIAQVADNTAIRGSDYQALARRNIGFPANQRFINISFEVLQDIIPEDVEEFTFELTTLNSPRVIIGGGGLFGRARIFIIDNDELTIGWERNLTTVNETHGTLELCIIIRNVTENTTLTGFSVMLFKRTIRGTAADPGDYTELRSDSIFVTIGDNNRRSCINVVIIDDALPEEVEFFSVQIVPPSGGLPANIQLDPDLTFVEILDNDELTIGWERNLTTVNETHGTLELCITIRNVAENATLTGVSVMLFIGTIRGTATDPGDYTALRSDSTFVIIGDDNRRSCINVTIIDDILLEEVEFFSVQIFPPSDGLPANIRLDPDLTFVEILDNDNVVIGFEPDIYTVPENDGPAIVTVRILQGGPGAGRTIEVMFRTADGFGLTAPAIEPDDYLSESRILQFSSTTTSFNIPISIINDSVLEFDEAFLGFLSLPSSDPDVLLSPDRATVTIIDTSRVVIGLEETAYTVEERDRILEVCAVLRQGSLAREAIVTLSSRDDTAVAPMDYQAISETLTFDRQTNRTCRSITIEDDAIEEPSEFFNVTLTTDDTSVTLDPRNATVTIIDDVGVSILVNDTIVGDPLFKVPIFVPNIGELDFGTDQISLCFEVHGETNRWFNLVTDECTSVNAHYTNFTDFSDPDFQVNVINRVAIRAVDDSTTCRQIMIDLEGCSVQLDGSPIINSRYSENGIRIRRYPRRVRVRIPNCRELSVIMWISCETQDLRNPNPDTDETITGDMIRVDVLRGLNSGHQDSHGLIGQYWSIPVDLAQYNGTLRDGGFDKERYVISVVRDGTLVKEFTGSLGSLLWDRTEGPCLYAGNRQAGPIYEVEDPNDAVIDGRYSDYRVPSAFDETGYRFGRFEESMCQ